MEHGVIHVYNYSGSVPDDVPAAAYAVWKNDPVGAYAVEFITTDCNLLVSYYEIRVDITYRHSRTELAAIEYVRGPGGAQRAIEAALDAAVPALVLRISAFDEAFDCQAIVSAYCAANPETVMEEPAVQAAVYPDSGSTRIVELNFTYEHTAEELAAMRSAVSSALTSAANYVRYRDDPAGKAELLFSYLAERFDYEVIESSTPVYALLCEGIANSRTFSQIWQILCDRVGIECQTVSGYFDGESYAWNILCIDGQYRHVDLMRNALEDTQHLSYYTDDEMTRYSWDREAYPVCENTAPVQEPDPALPPDGGESAPEGETAPQTPETPDEPPQEPEALPADGETTQP